MLVKLKRRFRRAKNVMCRTFRVEKREKLILQDFHVDWDGLSSFIEDMNKSPHASGPLKAAVDELRGCIGVFESNHRLATIRSREEYEKLGVDINDLFRALPIFIDGTSISLVHEHVAQLARDITNAVPDAQGEQLEVEQESERGMGVGKILVCYRQVRILLGRFVLTENTRIWEIQDENILATRLDILPHSPTTQYQPVVESNDVRPTGCMPNTRMNLLRQLRNWTHHDGGQRIFWLNGLAGTGKTTVASSFCEQLENSGNLAAGFFCSRYLSECRDFEHILPSISYQLSSISRPFRCALSDALKNLELHNLPLSEQLAKLVTEPLLKVKHTFLPNMIIVIDALDECPDDEGVKQILDILIKRASDSPVKFFITSRPTPTILNRMRSKEDERVLFELRLHDINRWGVDGDIQTYLVAELKPANLSEPQIESLVLQSGLSFNYAAAIVRYLGHNNFSQTIKRLNLLLGAPNSLAKESIRDIDTLYTTVMRTAFDNNVPESLERDETRLVLCTLICAQGPLTVEGLAGLLSFESASSVEKALLPLWPLLQVSDTSRLVTIQYEWVVNYMLDHQRSNRLHCDAKEHHTRLARICFDLIHMPNPPFNICKLESSYTRDWEVPNIEKRVQEAISPELLYACRHWGSHVELAGYPEDLLNRIHGFLATRLLLWMEILNLNRCIDAATSQLSRLHARLGEIDGAAIIQDLVHDAWRFALALSSSPMRDSTPHIYVSALPFWPKQRPVSKQYTRGMLSCVSVTGAGMRKREYASFAVLYSADTVTCIAYSPNGAYIVSASRDRTIRIWDTHTGQSVGQPLKGHTDTVNSVAYSPNGAYIVSGSRDKTIRMWDAQTGQPVGSEDNTIRIWDAHTGQPVSQPLEGHESSVHSVAYSPNGAYIVSGSGDETIRIWETRQAEMQEPVAEVSSTLSAPPPESENPLSHRAQHAPHISETATSRITECKSDEVGVLLDDWSLNEQGWVVNAKQDQLIWVPHELRDTRLRLRNAAVISHPGSIKLDFSDAKLGREWGRCFDPKRLLDVN
ncbi:hypothetical protein FRC08_007311 [Ceratobasidium sp. 394]|nr:hypothetical protein FRC08_007311 [Ceratobasidium sp. 394]